MSDILFHFLYEYHNILSESYAVVTLIDRGAIINNVTVKNFVSYAPPPLSKSYLSVPVFGS